MFLGGIPSRRLANRFHRISHFFLLRHFVERGCANFALCQVSFRFYGKYSNFSAHFALRQVSFLI